MFKNTLVESLPHFLPLDNFFVQNLCIIGTIFRSITHQQSLENLDHPRLMPSPSPQTADGTSVFAQPI